MEAEDGDKRHKPVYEETLLRRFVVFIQHFYFFYKHLQNVTRITNLTAHHPGRDIFYKIKKAFTRFFPTSYWEYKMPVRVLRSDIWLWINIFHCHVLQLQVISFPTKHIFLLPAVFLALPAEPPDTRSVRSVLACCREPPVRKNLLQFVQEKHLQAPTGLGHLRVRLQAPKVEALESL